MRKRVDVMYSLGGKTQARCMSGMKTVILMQNDKEEVDLTAVNVDDLDDVCDVLEDALRQARKMRSQVRSQTSNTLIATC